MGSGGVLLEREFDLPSRPKRKPRSRRPDKPAKVPKQSHIPKMPPRDVASNDTEMEDAIVEKDALGNDVQNERVRQKGMILTWLAGISNKECYCTKMFSYKVEETYTF